MDAPYAMDYLYDKLLISSISVTLLLIYSYTYLPVTLGTFSYVYLRGVNCEGKQCEGKHCVGKHY